MNDEEKRGDGAEERVREREREKRIEIVKSRERWGECKWAKEKL